MYRIEYKKDIYVGDCYLGTVNDGTYYVRHIDYDILEDLAEWIHNEITFYGTDVVDLKKLGEVFDNMHIDIEYFEQIYEDDEFLDGDRVMLSDYFKVYGGAE